MIKPLLQKEVNVMSSVRKEAGRAAKQIPRITRRRGGQRTRFYARCGVFYRNCISGTFTGPGFTIQRLLFTRPFLRVFFPAERGNLWT